MYYSLSQVSAEFSRFNTIQLIDQYHWDLGVQNTFFVWLGQESQPLIKN